MSPVGAALFLYGPLALIAVMLSVGAGLHLLRTGLFPERAICTATRVLVVLWLAACFLAVVFRVSFRDWVHLYWSAQMPLVGLFLGSGALLCRTWRAGMEVTAGAASSDESARRKRRWWSVNSAVLFLIMAATLGIAPLLLQMAFPQDHPSPRDTGAPFRGLWELAAWGFGGSRPVTLAPITEAEVARGLGHLPRDITVPMGATLIAAYLWIAFSLIAVGGRLIRSRRARGAFLLLAPPLLAVLNFIASISLHEGAPGAFDPRSFGPGNLDCGIWTCEPAVVRSYGPVLLVAFASALVLALCLGLEHLRLKHSPRTRSPHELPRPA